MKEMKKCNLCKYGDFEELFGNHDRFYRVKGDFVLCKCKNCGLIFINPQPDMQELEKHYPPEKYYSLRKNKKNTPGMYEKLIIDKNASLKKIILSPLRKFMRSTKIVPSGKILDIGCGSGEFLSLMNKTGMDCFGVDPGLSSKDISKNNDLHLVKGELKEAEYPSNFFDVITMNHSFEHVLDPLETLTEIKKILKRGGTAIIGVPQSSSLAFFLFGKNWVNLDTPRHLFIYNPSTLRMYANKVGLEVKKIRYCSGSLQITGSLAYLLNKWRIKKFFLSDKGIVHNKKLSFLLLPVVAILDFFKIGDSIEIFLEKK